MGAREREAGRLTDIYTRTERDRQTDTDRESESEVESDRDTERESREREMGTERGDRQTDRHMGGGGGGGHRGLRAEGNIAGQTDRDRETRETDRH